MPRLRSDNNQNSKLISPVKRMLMCLKPYPAKVILGSSCVLAGAYFGLWSPRVIGSAINDLQENINKKSILLYALLIVGIALVKGTFQFLQRKILVGLSRDVEFDLRNNVYMHLQKMSLAFFQEHKVGDLMSRATNDISNVRMLLGPAIMYGLNTIFITFMVIPSMASISGNLTLIALATLPFASIATKYFGGRINKRSEEIQEYFGVITARVQENFAGVRVIRAYAQEMSEEENFRLLNREFVRRNLRLIKLGAVFTPVLQILIGFGPALVLLYGGRLVLSNQISLGQFVEFNLYFVMLVWPMIALGYVVNLFQRGLAGMTRINNILCTEPSIFDATTLANVKQIQGKIEFRNLTFNYAKNAQVLDPVLRNISLEIPSGKTVAIVGHTGAGKSTLVNLIPRLIDASDGQIFIDGYPIRQIPLQILRKNIGYVPQETFLFGDTIAKNIGFGVPSSTDEEINQVADKASLKNDIDSFPNGFNTIVGERGITLSGGQKQRTALARAILRNPKILILDDALSSVDTYTEEKILKSLQSVMRGRTTILISHRISTVKEADEIIVLEKGEIAERGKHEELLKLNGLYAALYEKQLLEEEIAAI